MERAVSGYIERIAYYNISMSSWADHEAVKIKCGKITKDIILLDPEWINSESEANFRVSKTD